MEGKERQENVGKRSQNLEVRMAHLAIAGESIRRKYSIEESKEEKGRSPDQEFPRRAVGDHPICAEARGPIILGVR
jgi:hypothetical protein